ncbi:MAG: amino acid ABC transporter permease [Clostridium sp.]|jgi:polar amino acid transport system permease protein|nr:amino acid ABC transporter permease [Clostridium sp.]
MGWLPDFLNRRAYRSVHGGSMARWNVMLFDFWLVFKQIPKILKYLPVTLEIAVVSMFFALVVGFLVALIKMRKIPVLSQLASFYVSFTRGTPVIVQLYATYYGIPFLFSFLNETYGWSLNASGVPPIVFSLVALSLNEAAYTSESIRAALEAVDKGQTEAAQSIGMTTGQTLRRIVIPEALVVALPSLGNAFIGMIKGTSLVFATAVVEMTAAGKLLASRNFRYFEMYVSLAMIYWVITMVVSRLLFLWERRLKCNEREMEGQDAGIARLAEKV